MCIVTYQSGGQVQGAQGQNTNLSLRERELRSIAQQTEISWRPVPGQSSPGGYYYYYNYYKCYFIFMFHSGCF